MTKKSKSKMWKIIWTRLSRKYKFKQVTGRSFSFTTTAQKGGQGHLLTWRPTLDVTRKFKSNQVPIYFQILSTACKGLKNRRHRWITSNQSTFGSAKIARLGGRWFLNSIWIENVCSERQAVIRENHKDHLPKHSWLAVKLSNSI